MTATPFCLWVVVACDSSQLRQENLTDHGRGTEVRISPYKMETMFSLKARTKERLRVVGGLGEDQSLTLEVSAFILHLAGQEAQ